MVWAAKQSPLFPVSVSLALAPIRVSNAMLFLCYAEVGGPRFRMHDSVIEDVTMACRIPIWIVVTLHDWRLSGTLSTGSRD